MAHIKLQDMKLPDMKMADIKLQDTDSFVRHISTVDP